jgi:hypothetical protein
MSENSNKVLIGLLIGGAVALLLCCGVGFGVLYWIGSNEGFQQGFQEGFAEELADAGGDEFARQVRVEVEDNPVIVEHIGTISTFEHDFGMSLDEPGEDTYVFHLTGDKGSGKLRADCITVDAEHEDVPRAELIMDSGESYQLFPGNPLQ